MIIWLLNLIFVFLFSCQSFSYNSGLISGNELSLFVDEKIHSKVTDLIRGANSYIYIEMYEFTNQDIAKEIIEKKKKGVDIKIILEQKVERNGDIKNFLNGSGVAVRYYPYNKRGINHIKLIIIDGLIAVVGGANLGLHSPVNHDIAVTIKGPAVKILETVFHDDWDYSKIGGKKIKTQVKNTEISNKNATGVVQVLTDSDIGKEIIKHITLLKKSIDIEMFILTNKDVTELLIKGQDKKEKIKVRAILEPAQELNYGTSDKLRAAGVSTKWYPVNMDIEQKLHMKLGIFDNYIAVLGSSNWSYQGFEVNHECNVLIIDNKIVSELTKMYETDWNKSSVESPFTSYELDLLFKRNKW